MQLRLLLHLAHLLIGVSCYSQSLVRRLEERSMAQYRRTIFPGTLWCGHGNKSKGEDDLGRFNDTDACCREHDHCPDNIPAGGSKHGLVNTASFTKSHCDCDDRFYQCLKDVIARTRPLVAVTVGTVYFNVAAPQCFDEDYPIVKCLEEHGLFRRRCVSYELDKSRPKEWQWFDAKFF